MDGWVGEEVEEGLGGLGYGLVCRGVSRVCEAEFPVRTRPIGRFLNSPFIVTRSTQRSETH